MTIHVTSAPCVHHACEIEKALICRNVSDVAQPLLVWSVCGEVTLKRLWRRYMCVRTLRRCWTVLSYMFRSDSALLHDSRDRVAMSSETKFRKLVRDLRRAVYSARLCMNAHHGSLDGEPSFFTWRWQSLEKLVVTTRADFKQTARHAGRACAHEFVTDEGVLHDCSRAKYAAAFLGCLSQASTCALPPRARARAPGRRPSSLAPP